MYNSCVVYNPSICIGSVNVQKKKKYGFFISIYQPMSHPDLLRAELKLPHSVSSSYISADSMT